MSEAHRAQAKICGVQGKGLGDASASEAASPRPLGPIEQMAGIQSRVEDVEAGLDACSSDPH